SAILHFTKGLDYEEASVNVLLVIALLLAGGLFTVRSRVAGWGGAALRLGIIATIAFGYGTLGFWLLDPAQFRDNFVWREAMSHAVTFLTFGSDPEVVPHTRYAAWFLHSLGLTTAVTLLYGSYLFFRPAFYTFRLHPMELREAQDIIERHGRSDMDFFKAWPDKSFFFSLSRESFLAYRVGAGCAVVLGDPVGPAEEIPALIREFAIFCRDNDWPVAYHQATSHFLDVYESLGYHRFKIGDNAVVVLDQFSLEGSHARALRSNVNKIERAGFCLKAHEPPLDDDLLDALHEVSNSWLTLPGHRERQFTLGCFDRKYLSQMSVLALYDHEGKMQAFLNLIPSHAPGDASLDLMRRRADSINGVMDYLFTKVLLYAREKGFKTFSLGMAPMSGFQPGEAASAEEKAIHLFFRKWNLGFRYQGIRDYKAKFATCWEPRYVIYRNRFDLARLAIALRKVSEFPGMRTPPPEDET
ncbi:MAG: phosphatidylglycerol lysyltransferase domain-containing protein, partial [Bryobacterales bacterium]|nr:phosphatidylglycerol lysyltransferase domain-containing protein [Bryobacterales bacterium]